MFTHLHLHTTFSLLDGQCGIVPLVDKAKKLGMTSLAVTDHGNLFALKAFYDEARKQGIKPILGVEAYIVDHDHREKAEYFQKHRDRKEKRFHLCLHAKNLVGYRNLVRLISEAHINGYYYNPRIDPALLEKYHEGLHCSAACIAGEVAHVIDAGNMAEAERAAKWYKDLFGENYSLEVMVHKAAKSGPDVPLSAQNEFADLYQRQVKIVKGV